MHYLNKAWWSFRLFSFCAEVAHIIIKEFFTTTYELQTINIFIFEGEKYLFFFCALHFEMLVRDLNRRGRSFPKNSEWMKQRSEWIFRLVLVRKYLFKDEVVNIYLFTVQLLAIWSCPVNVLLRAQNYLWVGCIMKQKWLALSSLSFAFTACGALCAWKSAAQI